jgi:two-component system, response regulator
VDTSRGTLLDYEHRDQNILLVEDNPDDELLTLRALRSVAKACPVVTARDGEEAVECLQSSPPPALVLLDLKLPKLNGLEVLERLRRMPGLEHVPVVVLTSSREQVDVKESYRLGANSFVQKPVEFEEFIETVRLLGSYWLSKNVGPRG